MDTIYSESGWIDIPRIIEEHPHALMFVVLGARRIGKTYGVLKYYMENADKPIAYLRHTRQQLEMVCSGQNSPYLPIYNDGGIDTEFKPDGGVYTCQEVIEREDGKPTKYGRIIAQGAGVFATRGLASGAFSAIVFDEFIPERGAIIRKHSGYNLKSAWQTMSQLNYTPPLWLLANSNNLDNDILEEFGLIPVIEEMSANKEMLRDNGDIVIINAYNSPVSEKLKNTPLGRILNTGAYGGMAFSNEWTNNNFDNVRRLTAQNLREYSAGLCIGNVLIYGHKTEPRFYVTTCKAPPDKVEQIPITPDTPAIIACDYPALIYGMHDGTTTYNSFATKRKYINIITGGRQTC